jgi:hypothetical protein
MRRIAGAASVALILASCAQTSAVPAALLVPPAKPAVPAPGASDRQIGEFILRQDAALDTAIAQIKAIADIVGAQ